MRSKFNSINQISIGFKPQLKEIQKAGKCIIMVLERYLRKEFTAMENRTGDAIFGITSGKILPLKAVNDPIFAEEMMGKGVAIEPDIGEVYAPFDGTVISVFPTKHAISLKSNDGCELLIHVGLDTVKLNGEFLETFIEKDDAIAAGDLIMKFDLEAIKKRGYDPIIPVVILNSDMYETIDYTDSNYASKEGVLIRMRKGTQSQQAEGMDKLISQEYALEHAIVSALGGEKNIRSMGHCATRLRVNLNNNKSADLDRVKGISGVLGVVDAMGGLQIVIGNNVNQVYENIQGLYKVGSGGAVGKDALSAGSVINRMLNVLSDILSPTVPLIMGSGFITAILIALTRAGVNAEGSTYFILNTAAKVVFYFLPIILAYTSSMRFKCNPVYALFLGGLLLHPNITGLVNTGENMSLYGLPVIAIDYASSLIPIILSVWVLSHIEKLADKYVPNALKYVIKPLVVVMIMVPIVLCLTGPAGFLIGQGLGIVINFIHGKAAWLTVIILSALAPLLVMTGMHIALTPLIILTNFDTLGYDNMLLVAFIGMNFSQFAVALATFFKTKNKTLKGIAASCAITAFFGGVTEPTLYGISVKMKKPLYASFIGCFANGIFCALADVKIFAFAPPSFFTLPIFMNPDGTNTNFMLALAAIAITIVVTFIATWLLGFDDSVYA